MASVKCLAASPTVMAAETARQRWPAQPNALSLTILALISRSASGMTTTWFFAPPWHCTRLPCADAFRVDVFGDRRGAHEADGAHVGMVQQRIDSGFAADDQVHDAFGQTGLMQQLDQPPRGERHALGRLQNERVAAGDGVGQKPQRNHRREIERRDRRGDAERLADHDFVDAAGDIFEVVTLHQGRDAAGHFHVFDSALQFGPRFGEGFAVFLGGEAGDLVGVLFEQVS